MKTLTFKVSDPLGLHARPVAKLVQEANRFNSHILLSYQGEHQNLKSIFGILGLAIPTKADVEIHFEGVDEEEASVYFSTFVHSI